MEAFLSIQGYHLIFLFFNSRPVRNNTIFQSGIHIHEIVREKIEKLSISLMFLPETGLSQFLIFSIIHLTYFLITYRTCKIEQLFHEYVLGIRKQLQLDYSITSLVVVAQAGYYPTEQINTFVLYPTLK